MAKKSNRVPANRYLNYTLTHNGDGADSHYIDLAKNLSEVNRRFYTQQKVYFVKSVTVINKQADVQLRVATVPNTWVARNAWKRGKRLFEKMNDQVQDQAGSSYRGRYHDFKVMLSSGMAGDSDASDYPQPVDVNGNEAQVGEWVYSKFESPDGTSSSDEYFAVMLGDHSGSSGSRTFVGLIQSYGESRKTVSDAVPGYDNHGDDDPLTNLFDHGTNVDEIAENLQEDGDTPPYAGSGQTDTTGDMYPGAGDNLPSAQVVGITSCTDLSGGNPIGRIGGFQAICGLLEIETTAGSDQNVEILIELKEGDFKGVHAEEI